MKLSFRLKEPKAKTSYVYADLSIKGFRIKYSLGLSVECKEFDPKRQKFKGQDADLYNMQLGKYEAIIRKFAKEMELSETLTIESIRDGLNVYLRGQDEENKTHSFPEYIKEHIKRSSLVKRRRTILNYGNTLNTLLEFEKVYNVRLGFESFDYKFYHQFMDYCKSVKKLSPNSIGSHIRTIKAWLTVAAEEGINTGNTYKQKGFKVLSEEVESIYLTVQEIKLILEAEMPTKSYERVRDIFVTGCFTGLRISDYPKINMDNVTKGQNILRVRTTKTDEEVFIPLHPVVLNILSRYGGRIPTISQQKFNKYIKEVGKIAGLDTLVKVVKVKGNETIEELVPKYSLIASHCARRSFSTNAFKGGLPSLSIMRITGHRTEKNFLKYIKITKEENALLISNHAFFKE